MIISVTCEQCDGVYAESMVTLEPDPCPHCGYNWQEAEDEP